jgi:hypothetical protein
MTKTAYELIEIGEAKKFFELGVITGFDLVRAPMQPGKWLLSMTGKELRSWTLCTKLRDVKIFSSLDTIVGQVEQIAGREILTWNGEL